MADSSLSRRQTAAVVAAIAGLSAAASVAAGVWLLRTRERQHASRAPPLPTPAPPRQRISPPESPFKTAGADSGPASPIGRCWDWLSSSDDVVTRTTSSRTASSSIAAAEPQAGPAPAPELQLARSSTRTGPDVIPRDAADPAGNPPLEVRVSIGASDGVAAAAARALSEPPGVSTPTQEPQPPPRSSAQLLEAQSGSSCAADGGWRLESMSASSLSSLRVPSTPSLFGTAASGRQPGSGTAQYPGGGGGLRAPSGGSMRHASGGTSRSPSDTAGGSWHHVAAAFSADAVPGGELLGRSSAPSLSCGSSSQALGARLTSLSHPELAAAISLLADPEAIAEEAPAVQPADGPQEEGRVHLHELQLYRRPDGKPWQLGRGSFGHVSPLLRQHDV